MGSGEIIGVETGIGMVSGTGGGARIGAEPDNSGFVTKKNSSPNPVLA